jgi:hypothetical protein
VALPVPHKLDHLKWCVLGGSKLYSFRSLAWYQIIVRQASVLLKPLPLQADFPRHGVQFPRGVGVQMA